MQHVPVESSNVRSVAYDAPSKTLEVAFNSGGVYQYEGVPSHLHQDLMNAASKGAFLAAWIKGNYPPTRVG